MDNRSMRDRLSEFWIDHGRKVLVGTAAVAVVGGTGYYVYNNSSDIGVDKLTSNFELPKTENKAKVDAFEPVIPNDVKPAPTLPRSEPVAKKEVRKVHKSHKVHKNVKVKPVCESKKTKPALRKHLKSQKGKVAVRHKKSKREAREI